MTGYYERRKRVFDSSNMNSNDTAVHTIRGWNHEKSKSYTEELEEDEEEYEVEEEDYEYEDVLEIVESEEKNSEFLIDGKQFIPKTVTKKQTFADTHVKLTTYVERNLNQIIRMLHKQGQIKSITNFINDSIKDHLLNHYHKDN